MSYSYWISQCLVQWLTCRSLWLFCWMDAFEFPASSWSWGERRGWRQMLRGNQKSSSRWRGGRSGDVGIVSSSSLTSLHYLLSLLVKNSMPAFERDIHCLFGLFNFAWLKYLGSFSTLDEGSNCFYSSHPEEASEEESTWGQKRKMPQITILLYQPVPADVRMI